MILQFHASLYLCAHKILEQRKLVSYIRKEWRTYSNFWSLISTSFPPSLSLSISQWMYSPLDHGRFFSFVILYTAGRTPWTGDQAAARPLPAHRINSDIHASSGIETHESSVPAGEDGSYLRSRGHGDHFHISTYKIWISSVIIWTFSSYLTGNTLRFRCKGQPVYRVLGEIITVLYENHSEHTDPLWSECRDFVCQSRWYM
jgi:hypothetical protein